MARRTSVSEVTRAIDDIEKTVREVAAIQDQIGSLVTALTKLTARVEALESAAKPADRAS
jgi:hypothetical protein